jgi:hypothetical protein
MTENMCPSILDTVKNDFQDRVWKDFFQIYQIFTNNDDFPHAVSPFNTPTNSHAIFTMDRPVTFGIYRHRTHRTDDAGRSAGFEAPSGPRPSRPIADRSRKSGQFHPPLQAREEAQRRLKGLSNLAWEMDQGISPLLVQSLHPGGNRLGSHQKRLRRLFQPATGRL